VWARGDAGVNVPLTVVRGKNELTVTVKSVDRASQFAARTSH
jgi:hypothetical protein